MSGYLEEDALITDARMTVAAVKLGSLEDEQFEQYLGLMRGFDSFSASTNRTKWSARRQIDNDASAASSSLAALQRSPAISVNRTSCFLFAPDNRRSPTTVRLRRTRQRIVLQVVKDSQRASPENSRIPRLLHDPASLLLV